MRQAEWIVERWLQRRRHARYASEGVPVSGGSPSNLSIQLPTIYYVPLIFDGGASGGYPVAGTGYIDNYPVTLPGKFTKCMKLSTNDATSWPVNNIFLHLDRFVDNLLGTNPSTGRLLQLGGVPGTFSLELGNSPQIRKVHFKCGFPTNMFLSADWQGAGSHVDLIAFFNDDFDVDVIFRGI